jgi:rhodanese-related sulfurtransferase
LLFTVDYSTEQRLLTEVAEGDDHMEPETVARRMVEGDASLVVVDVRPSDEFETFHLKGALNVELKDLHDRLARFKNTGDIVLYSNGMTHPAQARDSLFRSGFDNVYIMTDGLNGFIERCLTPVSLRKEPVPAPYSMEIHTWRAYFLTPISTENQPLALGGADVTPH